MLEKIKQFFNKLLKKDNNKYLEAPNEIFKSLSDEYIQNDNKFISQIVIDNEEENRVLKLQKDFKAGLIEEENLSEEDFNALTNLYEKQIEKTKQSIENYKNRIIYIKSKLAQNN